MISDGVFLCRSVLAHPQLGFWRSRFDQRYELLEVALREGGVAAATRLVGPGERFVPTASSFTLGAVLDSEDVRGLFAGIAAGPAGAWIKDELGSSIVCDLDQAWVRRQYAPGHYPPSHSPHAWHQDGALGFDYLAYSEGRYPSDALLSLATCWIALGPCGTDAPGLEIVRRPFESLITPADLTDESVRARFAPEEFSRPVMETGDALLFRGDRLHRTHVTPAMTKDRTSIELRFFAADNLPTRLKNDRFVAFD